MEPEQIDPKKTAELVAKSLTGSEALYHALVNASRPPNEFPYWRKHQLLQFIKYAALYTEDLHQAYRNGRLYALAQAMRNLRELSIWAEYCNLSDEKAERFSEDAVRDWRELLEAAQKRHAGSNPEAHKLLMQALTDMENEAPKRRIKNFKGRHLDVKDAAKELGKHIIHSAIYKTGSKFAHPTSLLFSIDGTVLGLNDTIYEEGARCAAICLSQCEGSILTKYPNAQINESNPHAW
jgi:hypothetical protein